MRLQKRIPLILLLVALISALDVELENITIPYHELERDEIDLQGIFDSNECLLPKKEAVSLLKSDYGIEESSPDEQQRFILGKCNPVVFVPGIYACRLILSINCKGVATEEKNVLKDARIFCGEEICKDTSSTHEEHVIFPSIKGGPFTLVESDKNKYSSCLGYFMQFLPQKDCPENTCLHSKHIKVTYYGGSEDTVSKSKCGLKAVKDVLHTGDPVTEKVVNQGAPKVYHEMISKFKKMGYSEGFSLGAIPQDYRRFTFENTFAEKAFKYQVEQLYQNTGKPVVIIAHSYGTLLTLSALVKNQREEWVKSKVKRFIAMAPPFAGSSKLMRIFFKGMKDFNVDIHIGEAQILKVNYDVFGQNMMYKSMPVISELRPLPIISKLFNSEEYKEFGDAVLERIDLEKECANKNCDASTVEKKSQKFTKVFGSTFPSLSDAECQITATKKRLIDIFKINKLNLDNVYSTPCRTELYKEGTCPATIIKSSTFNPKGSSMEKYCGVKNSSILYDAEGDTDGYLDSLYSSGPFAFDDKNKLNNLTSRYNEKYGSKFGKIDASYFEKKAEARAKTKALLQHHKKNSVTQSLPLPPVDTTVLYTHFLPTDTSYVFDKSSSKDFSSENIYRKGGDGTVPNWSSYLTGLKWLYDKKKQKKSQDVTLVEYCSLLGKSGKYAYTEGTKKNFYAIGCDCINSQNVYKSDKKCDHGKMLSDNVLINYLKTIIYDKKASTAKTAGKASALKVYNKKTDFSLKCSNELKKIVDSE